LCSERHYELRWKLEAALLQQHMVGPCVLFPVRMQLEQAEALFKLCQSWGPQDGPLMHFIELLLQVMLI